jgi:hypothetical protein
MTTTTELEAIRAKAQAALAAVDDDAGASPVLGAVVREFSNKANKAVELGGGDRAWEAVVELEQAGDSAKAAADADADAAPATVASVQDAHLAICMLKAGFAAG